MLNNFIYAQTKALFEAQLLAGNILDEAVVFIEDTKEIWNHGTYFGGGDNNSNNVYVADFSYTDLRAAMQSNVRCDCDMQGLVNALRENKIILVKVDLGSEYAGAYVLNGYIEDLLYFSIISDDGKMLICGGTSWNVDYISGNTLTIKTFQEKIDDLTTIRQGASAGATAVQPADLAPVAVSGDYNQLLNKPTIPKQVIESTVSQWGFTKNTGTVTGVKINGTTKSPVNGTVDLGNIGGITTETDPVFSASPAAGITDENIESWNNKVDSDEINSLKPLITDFSIADIDAYVVHGTNFNYNSDSIINALQNKRPIYIPYENDGLEGFYAAYGFVEDVIYLDVLYGNFLYFIELNYTGGGIANIDVRNLVDFAVEGDLATVAFSGDYNDLLNKPTIPSAVTESTVKDWGFIDSIVMPSASILTTQNGRVTLDLDACSGNTNTSTSITVVYAGTCTYYSNPITNINITSIRSVTSSNRQARAVFTTGSDAISATFPADWKWANGIIPTIEPNTTYELSVYIFGDSSGYHFNAVLVPFKLLS